MRQSVIIAANVYVSHPVSYIKFRAIYFGDCLCNINRLNGFLCLEPALSIPMYVPLLVCLKLKLLRPLSDENLHCPEHCALFPPLLPHLHRLHQ